LIMSLASLRARLALCSPSAAMTCAVNALYSYGIRVGPNHQALIQGYNSQSVLHQESFLFYSALAATVSTLARASLAASASAAMARCSCTGSRTSLLDMDMDMDMDHYN
jgi:hypothetical protein